MPQTPVQLWSEENDVELEDDEDPVGHIRYLEHVVAIGQQFRNSLHPGNSRSNLPTFAPVFFPTALDIKNLTNSAARTCPLPDFWNPDATAEQVVQGAARDLAMLASVLAARTINATGFQPDQETIKHFAEIANGLRNVTYVLRETKPRRGRPPASAIQTGQNKRRRKNQATASTPSDPRHEEQTDT